MYKREEAEQFIETIPEQLKDAVYRLLWKEYVEEDCIAFCSDYFDIEKDFISEDAFYEACSVAAERYVEGSYDCNLSYWDNIENLMREYIDR